MVELRIYKKYEYDKWSRGQGPVIQILSLYLLLNANLTVCSCCLNFEMVKWVLI